MKQIYKLEKKQEIIEKYNISDLNKVKFCKDKGITTTTLRTWIKERKNIENQPKFIEIELNREKSTEIVIKIDKFSIKVNKNTDFDILGNLLRLVKEL